MRFYLLILSIVFVGSVFSQAILSPGIQMDVGDGQVFYTCDTTFFDSGGHYTNC